LNGLCKLICSSKVDSKQGVRILSPSPTKETSK
jgi:hypothetical protein